ncbi:MAG: gliding motility protein GldN [Bacteroidales bacterium]|nr:gliding motility protein GldN [Bacteroidales bacterium]
MKYTQFFLLILVGQILVAQIPPDRVWDKEYTPDRKPVNLPWLRKADVFWAERVWRVIDMREKINQPLYYPTKPTNNRINLISVLLKGLEEGTITAYSADNDEFTIPLSPAELKKKLVRWDTIKGRTHPITNEPLPDTVIEVKYDPASVIQFRIKEDWFFDKQRSVLDVRILGICPVREEYDAEGNLKGTRVDFWIYFPEARTILAKYEVYNRFNDGQRMSYDDFFLKRFFSSYVIKASNVYDRYISPTWTGLDALLKSEEIEAKIFDFEQDLWEY